MKKQTFILEIRDTKCQSWQGRIEWIQGQKSQNFRSTMEMLRLIESVVGEGEKPEESDGEDKRKIAGESEEWREE